MNPSGNPFSATSVGAIMLVMDGSIRVIIDSRTAVGDPQMNSTTFTGQESMIGQTANRTLFQVFLLVTLAVTAVSPWARSWARDPVPGIVAEMYLDQSIEQLGKTAEELVKARADADQAIAEARRTFWSQYPEVGETAHDRFATLLIAKDIHHLGVLVAEGPYSDKSRAALQAARIDGGVEPGARGEFSDWVIAVREALGAENHGSSPNVKADLVFVTKEKFGPALRAAREPYASYAFVRDYLEYRKAGYERDYFKTPEGFLAFLLRRDDEDTHTMKQALATLDEMAGVLGEDHVRETAEILRTARMDENGRLVDPTSMGLPNGVTNVHSAFLELIGRGPTEAYGTALVAGGLTGVVWEGAEEWFQWHKDAYGPEEVMNIVEVIQAARKTSDGGRVVIADVEALGIGASPRFPSPQFVFKTAVGKLERDWSVRKPDVEFSY